MSNSEHLAKLREGVEAWNTWRVQNQDIQPDLSGADLFRASLRHMDLSKADLSGADLKEADLSGAYLSEANFLMANFSKAVLNRASLSRANLREAVLNKANLNETSLHEANLVWTNLSGANLNKVVLAEAILKEVRLDGANLHKAVLRETIFADVDLTAVKGLESCIHRGPSAIDHRTLARSDNLPLSFLRGCGLPDTFIDYLPSLLNQPIQHYSCFISYASKDEAFAQRLHADLQDKGVRCWFAPEDMKIGDKILDTIDEAIRLRDKVLLVLSRDAINSEWVEDEVTKAYAEERRRKQTILFPIRIDKTVMRTRKPWTVKLRNNRNIGDFCNWKNHDEYQQGLERLLRDLRVEKDE